MQKWYVVQTKYKQEYLADEQLDKQDFTTYLPEIIIRKKYKGEMVNIATPLFPGYIFVRFDVEKDRWKAINNTRGVYRIIGVRDQYVEPLPRNFIDELMNKECHLGYISLEECDSVLREFVIGDELIVDSGVFEGFSGICQRVKKDRVVVLLSLLSGKTIVELQNNSVSRLKNTR